MRIWAALVTLSIAHIPFECNADDSKNDDAKFSKLRVLLQESPDGTILVSADRKWPNVRVAVQSLIDCNVTYSEAGFKAGAVISVKQICFRGIPKNLPTILAPSYRYNTSREIVHEILDSRQMSPARSAASPASVVDEKSRFSDRRTNTASSLSGKCLSSIQAPVLLNLSYVGKESLKIGDKMTWVYSIRQGTIPLAWVTLSLSNSPQLPYNFWIPPSTVSHNFSVPWNFDPENTVMSGSFTVKITADVMPGVYTLNQVSLTTQACPVTLSSTYNSGGGIYYSANPALGYTLVGPTVHHLPLLTSSVETYVVMGGIPTLPSPPQLIQLTYDGNTSLSYGQDLKWEYKVHKPVKVILQMLLLLPFMIHAIGLLSLLSLQLSQALMGETGATRDVPFAVDHDAYVRSVGPTFPSNLCWRE